MAADSRGFGYGVASPTIPATTQNEHFTAVLPLVSEEIWRTVAARRQSGTVTGRALEGWDAGTFGRLYLDCDLETAREIARQVKALRLHRGWTLGGSVQVERRQMAAWLCENCYGSGVYRWGACINGKPPVHSGPCFRCEGKGYQNDADRRRNFGYDNHRKVY